jgi:tetratricopeptide (TPR) repeat protein
VSDYGNLDVALKQAIAAHRAGRLREAIALYEQILERKPDEVQVLHLAGVVRTQLRDYERAIAHLRRCAALAPRNSAVVNNLGLALYPAGYQDEAILSFERALELKPDNATAANNLGNAHFKSRNLEPARAAFERALALKPDYLDARSNLGHCLVLEGRAEEALGQFERVLKQNPNYAHAIEGLASACLMLDRPDDVAEQRRRLAALEPKSPLRQVELGVALQAIDHHAEALACFQKALVLDSRSAGAHARIGWAKLEAGKSEEALASFRMALAIDPNSPFYWNLLVRVKKVAKSDGTLEALERLLPGVGRLAPNDQVYLHFALGKALADIGENERSFSHFMEGNRINRSQIRYDERDFLDRMDRAGTLYSPAFERVCAGHGNASEAPIFILGMPRTGSTLVEQILAAHPKVLAIGETTAFREAVRQIDVRKGSLFPDWLAEMRSGDADDIGNEYMDRLARIARAREPSVDLSRFARLTDKLPGNFVYLGLIHLALPNARVIHTRRDAVETCLSCFRIFFETLQFTCDLGELGRYYRHYVMLMERWKAVLPKEVVLDVDYETLVQDTESEARRIVAHCGLEWDDACLSFHGVERTVRTASVAQVRQPIYATSLKTWRPDEGTLKPLLDALAGR